ncbi:MAG: cell wall-binding repeat-containing protein [Solirubrobacteraceae bacterium]
MPPMPRIAAALCLAALVATGCGKGAETPEVKPVKFPTVGTGGEQKEAVAELGFPVFATKNTTRVGGADPVADAAAAARAVFPAVSPETRPAAVTLVDAADWQTALAASVLMSDPIRAPILLTEGTELPSATEAALDALAPTGSEPAGGAQVIRVGDVARPAGLKSTDLVGADPATLARAIDAFHASARGASSDSVVVVSSEKPEFAMPAAAWAAKSGDPILFADRDTLPEATKAAIAAHQQPHIYVLGPSSVISPKVTIQLRKLGTVTRVGGQDPATNAIEFAKYVDTTFGWGVVDPGHGLVFADPRRPADAAAASPLSASGTWGPLLLLGDDGELPKSVEDYLLDIQPGYREDPTRGVYNHGWIIGDDKAVSIGAQARIDTLLEIAPAKNSLPSQP